MKVKFLIAALVAAFAVSVVGAAAAQAEAVGPFWRTACHKVSAADKGLGAFAAEGCLTPGGSKEWDTRLLGGETSAVVAATTKAYEFRIGGIGISCPKESLSKATATGSTGATSGSLPASITFEGCTMRQAGEGCRPSGGKIKFEPSAFVLGYEKLTEAKERRGKVLMLLKPLGSPFLGNLKLEGSCNIPTEAVLVGDLVAELWSGGKAVEVGSEPATSKGLEINFPSTRIKTIWTESNGVLEEVEQSLSVGYAPNITLTGREEVGLASGGLWGVFTH